MLLFIIICLIAGCAAGFLAGLFGIGGGLVIVPILTYLLPMVGVPDSLLMATALGTSFATIIITSFSSAQRHHKLGNVEWSAAKFLGLSLMVATFISGLFVGGLDKVLASKLFACLVVVLAGKMLFSIKPNPNAKIKPLTPLSSVVGGALIGVASSVGGIGGGGFIVPFLNGRGVDIKKAIGTSSFCGALVGLSGMLSFITGGWNVEGMPDYSAGYVYLPAVLCITLTSIFTSKLGATATTKLPVPILKRAFAVFLIIIAINMLLK